MSHSRTANLPSIHYISRDHPNAHELTNHIPASVAGTFVEWKIGPPETVDTHSDSDIEASAEAFIADKVSQAWGIHHKR